MHRYAVLLSLLYSIPNVISDIPETRVKTEQGTVIGFYTNGNYLTFHGIRYGGNVTGLNRFKAASPPPIFQEFHANKDIICAQPTQNGLVGVEECLTLNVFTKNVTGRKPVYVWLNGEDYSRTNDIPAYSFKSLVQADLVVITVNYRLSIFGFLCLRIKEAPGNAGLKDVILALKWVKANIAAFGGDPDNIVLLGHGSGAAMVDLVTLSPQSKDLVHKAVAISGSGTAPWAVAFDPIGYAKAVGAQLEYRGKELKKLAEHLANVSDMELVNAINKFPKFTNSSLLFAPCIENTQLSNSFLEDAPINLMKTANYQRLPYVAIYVSDEGTLRAQEAIDGDWLKRMQENFDDFLPANLKFKDDSSKRNIAKAIQEYYFSSKNIRDAINEYLEYWGDCLVTIPMIQGVKERARADNVPENSIFLMKFDFKEASDLTWPYDEKIPLQGTRHGAILKYIFDLDSVDVPKTPKSFLTNRLIAFAKTGSPTAPTPPGDVDWPPVTRERFLYLESGGEQDTGSYSEYRELDPKSETVNYWLNTVGEYIAAPESIRYEDYTITIIISVILILSCTGTAIFYSKYTGKLHDISFLYKFCMHTKEPNRENEPFRIV